MAKEFASGILRFCRRIIRVRLRLRMTVLHEIIGLWLIENIT